MGLKEPKQPLRLHPDTDILTRGFDPKLPVGSARPAVFRSSTDVFSSGLTEGLVCIPVGVEDGRDLLADFESALGKV